MGTEKDTKDYLIACALDTQARLAVIFWDSLKESMASEKDGLVAIDWRHLDACMGRISEILDGDPSSAYPPGALEVLEGQVT